MTPDQFAKLLEAIINLADRPYTITGAADWPILVALCGIVGALIAVMWFDLRNTIKDGRREWKDELKLAQEKNEIERQKIWTAMHDCQTDCCPRRRE